MELPVPGNPKDATVKRLKTTADTSASPDAAPHSC